MPKSFLISDFFDGDFFAFVLEAACFFPPDLASVFLPDFGAGFCCSSFASPNCFASRERSLFSAWLSSVSMAGGAENAPLFVSGTKSVSGSHTPKSFLRKDFKVGFLLLVFFLVDFFLPVDFVRLFFPITPSFTLVRDLLYVGWLKINLYKILFFL
ncbi:MAG: hypothetical protein R6X08_04295 [Desulfosalsimonadaceae bacterium]